jgi:geranyl-CoA carboxylase beta subunit
MVKHGSKMIQAVANATVPQITLVIGSAYGAGYYGMCGRPYDPRFIFSWPSCRVAVMGGEQAARVMAIITKIDRESTAFFATARLWDDGIIDPRDSRKVLGFALETVTEAEARDVRPSSFGVARM